jgi:predicted RNA-binding Zn-ribbon protein involved in translation (DUF1610 family)
MSSTETDLCPECSKLIEFDPDKREFKCPFCGAMLEVTITSVNTGPEGSVWGCILEKKP